MIDLLLLLAGAAFAPSSPDAGSTDLVLHPGRVVRGAGPAYSVTPLAYATTWSGSLTAHGLMFTVPERDQGGTDLDGDGDADDHVPHYLDFATGLVRIVDLPGAANLVGTSPSGRLFVFGAFESSAGDLNGDGDDHDYVPVVHDVRDGVTQVVPVAWAASEWVEFWADRICFLVSEGQQGETDLNGDGDAGDLVPLVFAAKTSAVTSLGISSVGLFGSDGPRVLLEVSEAKEGGLDLNGDGDAEDSVVHLHDLRTGTTVNVGVATPNTGGSDSRFAHVRHGLVVCRVSEERQGNQDLNGDGETRDIVYAVHDARRDTLRILPLAAGYGPPPGIDRRKVCFTVDEYSQDRTDLNGDGDLLDDVWFVHDVLSGTTVNLGFGGPSAPLEGPVLAVEFGEAEEGGVDLNGDGDTFDDVLVARHLVRNETIPLGLAISFSEMDGDKLFLFANEAMQGGTDLNGDGDAIDPGVLLVADLRRRRLFTTGRATTDLLHRREVWHETDNPFVTFRVDEGEDGRDHDGDGVLDGNVAHAFDLDTGTTTNLGLPVPSYATVLHTGPRAIYFVLEVDGEDWNADGDLYDIIPVLVEQLPD